MRRALPLALLTLLACSASHDEARDRHRVAYAIDAIRDVPASEVTERLALAESLSKLDVNTPLAVRARDECSRYYRSLAQSTRLMAVASAGADPKSSADPVATLNAARDAETSLADANEALPACEDASAAIRARP